jgi:membrane fusion protein (multidrug efflux system)
MNETTETQLPLDTSQAPPNGGPPPGSAPGPGGKPPSSPSSGPGNAPAVPKRKPPFVLMAVLGILLIVGGIFGGRWWAHRQAFVATDDAQVAGDLVAVSARVPGHIAQLLADEGQTVKENQVIAKLDDTDFRAQIAQAEAALAVAKSNLASSETGVSLQASTNTAQISQGEAGVQSAEAGVQTTSANVMTATAGLATARANARKYGEDAKRTRKLFAVGGASRQQLEAADAAAQAADASIAASQGQLASARGQLASAHGGLASAQQSLNLARANTQQVEIKRGGVSTVQAQIQQAQAALTTAKLQLDHTTILAPNNGIVARRMANVGEQVQPGQGIFSIAKTDNIWVLAYIEETEIRRVHQGAAADVHIDAFPNQIFKGKVSLVNAVTGSEFSLMPQNNASGNFTKVVQRIPIKLSVEDPNHQLKPGMSAVIDVDAKGH